MMIPRNRVNQLDSKLLDDELFNLLYSSFIECFQHPNLPRFLSILKSHHALELRFVLKLVLFKYTIWNSNSSYGMGLQNLKLAAGGVGGPTKGAGAGASKAASRLKLKKSLLLALLISNYGYQKLESYLYSGTTTTNNIATRVITTIPKVFKIGSLLNFLAFLIAGNYPNIWYRLLNLKLVKLSKTGTSLNDSENISYEFQNRQLIWNTLTEFLIFIIPMFNLSNGLSTVWTSQSENMSDSANNNTAIMAKTKAKNKCGICLQDQKRTSCDIVIPYETNCGHVYCYICIVQKLEIHRELNKNNNNRNNFWHCLECGRDVEWCRRYRDVDVGAIIATATAPKEVTGSGTGIGPDKGQGSSVFNEKDNQSEDSDSNGIDSDELEDEMESEAGDEDEDSDGGFFVNDE